MSSAGVKSTANEGGTLVLSGTVVEEEWREIVKENSCDGDEDAEGGEEGDVGDRSFGARPAFPS